MQPTDSQKASHSTPDLLLAGQRMKDRNQVTLQAAIMAVGTLSSRVLGLVRDAVVAAIFPRIITDAWTVAFRLPNMLRRLLGEGSLAVAFITVFIESMSAGQDSRRAHSVMNGIYSLLLTVVLTIVGCGIIWMEPLLDFLVRGQAYQSIPGKFEITVKLARIMFGFIFLMSLYAYFMAILNSLRQFALAAFAPCLFNISMIIAAIISQFFDSNSQPYFLGWGVLAGGILQMIVLIPALMRQNYFPKFTLQWTSPDIFQVLRSILPSMLGTGVLQLMAVVNIRFASYLPEGSHSYIYWADRVLELPLSLFAVSLGSALLPALSRLWTAGDTEAMTEVASHYLRLILFVSIPCAFGFWYLSDPIVSVIYQRGAFSVQDVQKTSDVLSLYAFSLFSGSVIRVMVPSYYAIKNTWLPTIAALTALILHLVIGPYLVKSFGLQGLIGSTVLSSFVNMFILLGFYRVLIGSLKLRGLCLALCRFFAASVAMILSMKIYEPLSLGVSSSQLGKIFSLVLTISLSCGVYLLMNYLFKSPELTETVGVFRDRLKRKLSQKAN